MWVIALLALILSLLGLMLSVLNSTELLKQRINSIQRIKLSVRKIDADVFTARDTPPESIPPRVVRLSVVIRVLLFNDGNRASFIDQLDMRLDALSASDRTQYFAASPDSVPKTPYQFSLHPAPPRLNWMRSQYDCVKMEPDFP